MAANSLCSSTQRKSDPKGNSEAIRAASSISKCRAQPENLPQTCGLTAPAQENSGGAEPQTCWVREQVCCRAGLEGRAGRHRGLFSSLKTSWSLACQVLDMSGVHRHFLLPYFSPAQQEHLSYASFTPGLWKAGSLFQFTSSQRTDCVSGRILRRVAPLPDADGDYIQLWN